MVTSSNQPAVLKMWSESEKYAINRKHRYALRAVINLYKAYKTPKCSNNFTCYILDLTFNGDCIKILGKVIYEENYRI